MPMTKPVKIEIRIPSCQPSQPPIVIPKRFRRRLMTFIPSSKWTTSPLDGWLCFEGSGPMLVVEPAFTNLDRRKPLPKQRPIHGLQDHDED